ncbi:Protein Setsip [Manis pentadactyla]|nr:Protein Setsip [Manis pentadactyla]
MMLVWARTSPPRRVFLILPVGVTTPNNCHSAMRVALLSASPAALPSSMLAPQESPGALRRGQRVPPPAGRVEINQDTP